MRNIFRLVGFIVMATVIGFSFAACSNGSTGGGGQIILINSSNQDVSFHFDPGLPNEGGNRRLVNANESRNIDVRGEWTGIIYTDDKDKGVAAKIGSTATWDGTNVTVQ